MPATRQKGAYLFTDTAREARYAGVPYGNFYDPIGDPVRRCYSIYPWAVEQGRGNELLSSFLRAAFAEGVNTNKLAGLKTVVENAGLDWAEAQQHLGETAWEEQLEQNRLAMYEMGLWGVPSFHLKDADGDTLLYFLVIYALESMPIKKLNIQRQPFVLLRTLVQLCMLRQE